MPRHTTAPTPEAEAIRAIRESSGLTQQAFGAALGIPRRTVQNWEGGISNPPQYVIELIKDKMERMKKMETKKFNRYSYRELRAAALAPEAAQADIDTLGAWMEQYGTDSWNGETYDIDDGKRLRPIYKQTSDDSFEITGYEIV